MVPESAGHVQGGYVMRLRRERPKRKSLRFTEVEMRLGVSAQGRSSIDRFRSSSLGPDILGHTQTQGICCFVSIGLECSEEHQSVLLREVENARYTLARYELDSLQLIRNGRSLSLGLVDGAVLPYFKAAVAAGVNWHNLLLGLRCLDVRRFMCKSVMRCAIRDKKLTSSQSVIR